MFLIIVFFPCNLAVQIQLSLFAFCSFVRCELGKASLWLLQWHLSCSGLKPGLRNGAGLDLSRNFCDSSLHSVGASRRNPMFQKGDRNISPFRMCSQSKLIVYKCSSAVGWGVLSQNTRITVVKHHAAHSWYFTRNFSEIRKKLPSQ